jgi:Uma2 family endonuclease
MSTQTLLSVEEYLASSYEPDCDYVDGQLEERNVGEWSHSTLQGTAYDALKARQRALGILIKPELRLRVKPTRFRVPDLCVFLKDPHESVPAKAPFLCIEILSPDDRMIRVGVRIKDFLEMGVAYVWVLDPETGQAYIATAAEGLREIKSGLLRTENPVIEIPLAEIFV